ncbi:hypothetical protein [Chitinophaga filiformis]|uniref:Uncharacterized protein n=1 Tax=Chitinophaga filiformis TaxID=104663 RepID=A0A1G7NN03_CHIFI|nr:hypothetical protein [Chitinophaga filiformis]SDF75307.1 hypothetical protein SAMN04488121_102864 [Chitinophaga filiformis]
MSEKILVPVKIEALIVDKNTAKDTAYNWKNFYIDYDGLYTRLGSFLEPGDLKELRQGGFCEKGIHLHWALPAALTNGIQKDGKALFPAVPNRWLVIRTHLVNNQPVIKKWLLESDYIGDFISNKSPWAVQNPDGSYSTSHNIGKATVLENWTVEQPRSTTPLTAMAPGNASFAGIYQYCRNVFGLWDDLAGMDTTATSFSYLVTGWYSDSAIEPLTNSDALIINSIKSKWALPGNATANFPDSIMCHGFIHSVNWDPAKTYGLPVSSAVVNTGVGMTAIEAKSAQLSRQTGAAEKLLSGYFYDILKDTVDATEMDVQIDSHAYTAYDGGSLWEIKHVEKDASDKEGKESIPVFPEPDANPGISAAFKKINTEQQAADRLIQKKTSLMLEFRALTDKMIMADTDGDQALLASLTTRRDLLKNDIDVISTAITQHKAAVTAQQAIINQMPAFIGVGGKAPLFELVEKKMPRYWQPNDPSLLFSGPGVTTSSKYKNPGKGDKLPCRTAPEIIAGMILNDNAAGERTISAVNITLGLKELGSLKNNISLISQLYYEAILFDPSWTTVWAQQYYKDNPGNNVNIQALAAYLKNMLLLTAGAATDKFKAVVLRGGTPIRPQSWSLDTLSQLFLTRGIQRWQHPWTPLYLIWYVKFIPSYTVENGQWQFRQQDWQWENKQYKYKGAAPDTTKAIEYAGKVLLTDMVNNLLQQRLPENVPAGAHLSQALASFSDSLLMRGHTIHIPLLRNPADTDWVIMPDNSLDNYISREAYFFPDVHAKSGQVPNFFPLRAGHLRFTRLWMVDAFGQVKKIIDTDSGGNIIQKGRLHIAEHLNQLNNGVQITLSPRVIQPARLLFRWCTAQPGPLEESSSDPATNPVCGWLLPDHLDQSLDIYTTNGIKCGALKMVTIEGRVQLQWSNPPGAPNDQTPETAISNGYLLDFVKGLLGFRDNNGQPAGGAALRSLFELCNRTALFLSTSGGQQAPGIAGLMGQPVALVRAGLQLELQGLPAQPQHYEHSITEDTKVQPPGLANLQFPIALGDSRNNKDGLIGYFKDTGKGFEEMHIPYGMPKPASGYFTSDDIQLSFAAASDRQGITLLMDPRGGVQANAGILPAKFIDLPASYTDGLKHMELDMLTAPFLGTSTEPFIPLGAEPDRQWVLKQQTTTGGWQETNMDNQTQLQTGSLNGQVIQEGYLSLLPTTNNQ